MRVFILILLFLSFMSCKKNDLKNQPSEIIISLSPFLDIEVHNSFDILIVEDSIYELKIIGKQKNIEKIEYEIENDKLSLYDKRKMKFLNPKDKVKIEITSPLYSKLILNGGCNVSSLDTIKSNEFGVVFKNHGNFCDFILSNNTFYTWNERNAGGEIILSGKTDFVKLWYSNLMQIKSQNLVSRLALIEISSDSDCYINVEEKLEYKVCGKGNIYLSGNPVDIVTSPLNCDSQGGRLIVL